MVIRYLLVLMFYMLGQFLLVVTTAFLASKSQLNGIRGLAGYFALRWPPLALRWFISLCLFLLVWNNPKVMDLDNWLPNFPTHLGLSGIFGWVSDSVLDKVLAIIFPGIMKELPPIPDPGAS